MERVTTLYHWIPGILGLVGCLISSGCASVSKGEIALDLGIKDRGVASWYGREFHGRVAANGETFDMTALTAAHRKLPLGSLVRVINLVNGKQVHVRINDRGPYIAGRILDVSHAAAAELGMVDAGTSIVHLEVIGQHRPVPPVREISNPMTAKRLLWTEPASAKIPASLEAKGRTLEIQIPPPMERHFPREILHERRERRHVAELTGDYTGHNPIPTLVLV